MTETKNKKSISKKTLIAGIIQENPVFVSLLGMCSALATTTSIESALGMGLLVIFTLVCSNVLISLLRKLIPAEVKIPCYIIIIATFVTIVKMLTEAFLPDLYQSLGVFISLIVVNCIILGRAESFASKNSVGLSLLDGIGSGIGYTLALVVIAVIREFFGTGGFAIGVYFPIKEIHLVLIPQKYTISLLTQPTGGFLTFGIVLGIVAYIGQRKAAKAERLKQERIQMLIAKKQEENRKKAEEAAKAKALEEANNKALEAKAEDNKAETSTEAKEAPKQEVKEEAKQEEKKDDKKETSSEEVKEEKESEEEKKVTV
jgi:electron transport complex protein RnfE